MKPNVIDRKVKQALEKNIKPFRMQYRKTKHTLVSNNCGIDLVNETGHSYGWWVMFKRINGVLVLNNYNYSSSTAKHINKASHDLQALNIKFISIEAPKGLQDLDSAKYHAAYKMAEAIVKDKYSRSKRVYELQYATKQVANLKKIKVIVSNKLINECVQKVELRRREKLDRLKLERQADKRKLAVVQFNNTLNNIVSE